MFFAARLSTNSLASPDNLRRWGKRKMGTCPLCGSPNATLAHITNMCKVALNQKRFTWRHDSVLLEIASVVKNFATEGTEIFSDLPTFQVNGTTIPADILVSTGEGSKPDLVLLNRRRKTIALLELTCSLPGSATKAHTFKDKKYTQLALDLEEKGYQVFFSAYWSVDTWPHIKPNQGKYPKYLEIIQHQSEENIVWESSQNCIVVYHEHFPRIPREGVGKPSPSLTMTQPWPVHSVDPTHKCWLSCSQTARALLRLIDSEDYSQLLVCPLFDI